MIHPGSRVYKLHVYIPINILIHAAFAEPSEKGSTTYGQYKIYIMYIKRRKFGNKILKKGKTNSENYPNLKMH